MIQLNRIIYIFLIAISFTVFSQENIYNLDNSKKYANFLYQSGDYELAAQEYERIIFLDSLNIDAKLQLLRSYRFLKRYDLGIDKYKQWNIRQINFEEEYIKNLLLSNYLNRAESFLETTTNFESTQQLFYKVASSMLAYNIQKADSLLQDSSIQSKPLNEYRTIIRDVHSFHKKRIGIALPMSMIVPGAGKIYVGYWKDGLMSLLLTGLTVWQTQRAFEKKGIRSVYGWVYAGLGTGFYIGNLYGTVKSVKKFNNNFKHKIIHRIEKVTFTAF